MSRRGFVPLIAIGIAGLLLFAGIVGCFAWKRNFKTLPAQVPSQQDSSSQTRATNTAQPSAIPTTTISTPITEGCNLLPYNGTKPLNQLPYYHPGDEDRRGGMVCKFTINPKLPIFMFHFTGQEDNTFGNIDISEGNDPKVIQTIAYRTDPNQDFLYQQSQSFFNPTDLNFDGYKDLRITTDCGATGNCSSDVYLYDPGTNRFVENSFLSNLVNVGVDDSAKKQITASWNSSVADYEADTYQYQDGRYALIKKEIWTWDRSNNAVVKTYELHDGKMELKSTTTPK